jgi:penicillin-binding protein 1A
LGLSFAGALFAGAVVFIISMDLPPIDKLEDYSPPVPSQILSKDGSVLLEIGKETREIASFDELPENLINAFVSAEDDRFYIHHGVDFQGMLRALLADIRAGGLVQGGSTITQQVAKQILLSREKSFIRKIKDILLAVKIEQIYSKKEILFFYLNHIYLGGSYHGVKAAFRGYFDKDLSEATVAESALIAGLPVAPSKYSPYRNPKYAKIRQKYVLRRMLETNSIDKDQYEEALIEKIRFRIRKPSISKAGHFTDWVRQRVIALVGEENFLTKGYKVSTTLDLELQNIAEKQVNKGAKEIDKRQGYKGSKGSLLTREEMIGFEKKFRQEIYSKKSLHFTLNPDGTKVYELNFDEDEYDQLVSYWAERNKEVKNLDFEVGHLSSDSFANFLMEGESYNAIVRKVSDKQRMVYVTVGGVKCAIPHENFRWARERLINPEPTWRPYADRPSKILKAGDIVLVDIKTKKLSGVWRHLWKVYRKNLKNESLVKEIKKEKYMICGLDQYPEVEGALVSINSKNGHIISMVGGKDFSKSQFNRVLQSNRQPGSSFKPFVYALALEKGFTPASLINDSPEALGGVDDSLNWKPRNYDGKFKGPITLRKSLQDSRNVPTVKLAAELGVKDLKGFLKRIGFKAKLPDDLSISLGSIGVKLIDLVASYSLFPNMGKKLNLTSITTITDGEGNAVDFNRIELGYKDPKDEYLEEQASLEPSIIDAQITSGDGTLEEEENPFLLTLDENQVYDKRLSYLMVNLLRGVVQNGTGRAIKHISQFIGGKTGTTNSYVDALFMGFSSNIITGVWTGFDNNRTLGFGETGAKSAMPIWAGLMEKGLKRYGEHDFVMPSGVINVLIDSATGKLADDDSLVTHMESFVQGTEPGVSSDEKYNFKKDQTEPSDLEEDDYYTQQ